MLYPYDNLKRVLLDSQGPIRLFFGPFFRSGGMIQGDFAVADALAETIHR